MTDEANSQPMHLPWDEGLPTRPDVDALLKSFPPETLVPGTKISDGEFLEVVGRCAGNRFRTVYAAWSRRLARDHCVVLKRKKLTGFYVPTAAEVISDTYPTLKHIGRSAGKQIRNLTLIKPADGIEYDTRDHHGRLMGQIKRDAKKARGNLLPTTVAEQLPQIAPPARGLA